MTDRTITGISIALWLACVACLVAQLFIPPFIGIANNGDFGKVSGHLALLSPDGGESNFSFFQPKYVHAARNYWNSPYTSSETLLAWTAFRLSGATGENDIFDIRWLGAVHVVLFMAAFAVFLRGRRIAVAPLVILIFTDVSYAAYMNSFYMDTAAFLGFLIFTAAAFWTAATAEPSPVQIVIFMLAALLYVTSKTQHAIWCFLPAAFLAWSAIRCRRALTRRLAWCAAGAVLIAGGLLLATADPTNRAQALFNKLFFQIGVAPGGAATLRELGVQPDELRYIGTHTYMPGSPALDQVWAQAFYTRTGYGRLGRWYLWHPGRTVALLWDTLVHDGHEMRQSNLSNFRREEGQPTGARTNRFAVWSNLRRLLLERRPWHMVLWYALFLIGVVAVLRLSSSDVQRRIAWLGLGIALFGLGHFTVAALADCLETGRHLFLFQACTDVTFCLTVAYLAARFQSAVRAR